MVEVVVINGGQICTRLRALCWPFALFSVEISVRPRARLLFVRNDEGPFA